MRRIAVFIGTRPEAIKMAPVIAALKRSKQFEPVVVNTGQHRELIEQVIDLFEIEIDRDLAVMEPNQSLAPLLARLLTRIDIALSELRPDMVLAQGDTSTVLTTALAAFHFAPTKAAADNLRHEGIADTQIIVTGNTVIDALFMELERQRQPEVQADLAARLRDRIGADFGERPFVLVTGHRRENFGAGFDHICDALASLATRFP